jgi:hypothetical protein
VQERLVKSQFVRIASLILTAFAAGTNPHGLGLVTPAVAVESGPNQSCMVGVDFQQLSYDELHELITRVVHEQGPALRDWARVSAIGKMIRSQGANCSPAELSGLVRNVAVILEDLGIDVGGNNVKYLSDVVGTGERFVASADDGVTLAASVY